MSDKPADIPQDVWDAARDYIKNIVGVVLPHQVWRAMHEALARAIIAAKAEERAAKDAIIAELVEALRAMLPESNQDEAHCRPSFEVCEKARNALSKASQD